MNFCFIFDHSNPFFGHGKRFPYTFRSSGTSLILETPWKYAQFLTVICLLQTDITLRDTKPNNMWKLGAVGRLCVFASLLMVGVELVSGTLPELECPEDCYCHYFRINWVTDCSDSNFTEMPYEGLSQNVYILNMNSNNVTEVQSFPEDIKLRRLQLADNFLTKLSRQSFAGLSYLLDADFSGNRITHVDPDAFRLVVV